MTSIARRLDDDRRRLVVVASKLLISQVAYLLLDLAEAEVTGQRVVGSATPRWRNCSAHADNR